MTIVMAVSDWFSLFVHYLSLSLLSVGGAITTAPDMHRYLVDEQHWLTDPQFSASIAIAQAAPGPNILFAGLVGWKLAGLPGALVALGAICTPAAVISWWVSGLWEKYKEAPRRMALQRAMAPLVVGLIFSGGFVIATPGPVPDWRLWLIAGAAAAAMLASKINPLWFLGAGGALGVILLS